MDITVSPTEDGKNVRLSFYTSFFVHGIKIAFNLNCLLFSTRGSVSLSSISDEFLSRIRSVDCGITCNFIWDGGGRWVQHTWKSHVKGT